MLDISDNLNYTSSEHEKENSNGQGHSHSLRKRPAFNNVSISDDEPFDIDLGQDNDDGGSESRDDNANAKIYRPDSTVCKMFDHIGTSNWYASLAYITILNSIGVDTENIVCSAATIFRGSGNARTNQAAQIQCDFDPHQYTTIQWDGKKYLMKGNRQEKRLAVVQSNSKNAKLLKAVEVADSTARTHANVVYEVMNELNNIVAMCFDTEATNTGIHTSVCKTIQELLYKLLISLPCRPHIYEVLLSAAYSTSVEKKIRSDGPLIELFHPDIPEKII